MSKLLINYSKDPIENPTTSMNQDYVQVSVRKMEREYKEIVKKHDQASVMQSGAWILFFTALFSLGIDAFTFASAKPPLFPIAPTVKSFLLTSAFLLLTSIYKTGVETQLLVQETRMDQLLSAFYMRNISGRRVAEGLAFSQDIHRIVLGTLENTTNLMQKNADAPVATPDTHEE